MVKIGHKFEEIVAQERVYSFSERDY
jgi:hypothetical protein